MIAMTKSNPVHLKARLILYTLLKSRQKKGHIYFQI
jgi:hypothetical protein